MPQETTVRIQNLNVVAEALRRTQEQYRLLREQSSDGVIVIGDDGRVLDANEALSRLLGYSRPELLALRLRYLIHEDALAAEPGLLEALHAPDGASRKLALRHRDGRILEMGLVARPLSGGGLQVTLRQDAAQERIARELAESEQRFLRLLHSAPDPIVLASRRRIVLANESCALLLGVSTPEELLGRAIEGLAPADQREELREALEKVAATGSGIPVFDSRLRRADGSVLDVRVVTATTTHKGAPAVQVVFRRTEGAGESLLTSGTRDPLTGLPNRELLDDRLSVALAQAFRQRHLMAVMRVKFLGLDRVVETLGPRAGDALVRAAADRLVTCVREGDTVSRSADAEFSLLLPGVRFQEDVITIADKVFTRLEEPFRVEGTDLQVGAVGGISLFPEDGDGPEALMRHAAEAMEQAESRGRGYRLYAEQADEDPLEGLGGNGAAPNLGAAANGHGTPGVLHFQPVYGIASRRVEGFEAFLRWQHPELGLVFPRHFLSKADFTGLILAIGPWIVETACAQIRAWQRKGNRSLRLAVNLSPWELQHPDLVNRIGHALRETGLAPRFLQLEVPEEWAFDQVDRAIETIRGLRSLGATVCLDGFGDGASSLMLLRRVPVDAIKLNLFGERAGAEIATRVASAIALAKSLQLRVIAQGVESSELLEQLRSWQCDEVQGYHWGPPMSAPRCEELLTQFTGRLRPWARPQTPAQA